MEDTLAPDLVRDSAPRTHGLLWGRLETLSLGSTCFYASLRTNSTRSRYFVHIRSMA